MFTSSAKNQWVPLFMLFLSALVTYLFKFCWQDDLGQNYGRKCITDILPVLNISVYDWWVAKRCQWCWCNTLQLSKMAIPSHFFQTKKCTKIYIFTRITGQYNATLPQTPQQVSVLFSSQLEFQVSWSYTGFQAPVVWFMSGCHVQDSRHCLI